MIQIFVADNILENLTAVLLGTTSGDYCYQGVILLQFYDNLLPAR